MSVKNIEKAANNANEDAGKKVRVYILYYFTQ